MNRSHPGFHISDMNSSIAWYKDFLKFECTFSVPNEDSPPYAIVSRDGVSIHLAHDKSGTKSGRNFCYIETDDIDNLYKELDKAGVVFVRRIEDSSYGMRDFVIKDCEGNEISFGRRRT